MSCFVLPPQPTSPSPSPCPCCLSTLSGLCHHLEIKPPSFPSSSQACYLCTCTRPHLSAETDRQMGFIDISSHPDTSNLCRSYMCIKTFLIPIHADNRSVTYFSKVTCFTNEGNANIRAKLHQEDPSTPVNIFRWKILKSMTQNPSHRNLLIYSIHLLLLQEGLVFTYSFHLRPSNIAILLNS